MPAFLRAVTFLLAAGLVLHLTIPAAAQANRKTLGQVSQFLLRAHQLLSQDGNTEAARAECEKAKAVEAKAKDPFVTATVHMCFGDVADHEEDAKLACMHFAAALKSFKAVPAKHSARRTVNTHMNVTEGKRMTIGCDGQGA